MKLFLLLFLFFNLSAKETIRDYSLRVGYGYASQKNLGDILVGGDFSSHPRNLHVYALDGGYLLKKNIFSWPLDIYLKSGLAYFNEDQYDDAYEATLYAKAYFNFDFWSNRVRLGAAEGVSYTSAILETEDIEAKEDNDPTSKFLNYLDISLDFDFGKLIGSKALDETYVGYALKHRSGVFGLYNGVHGGSNYNTFYVEKNF